MKISRRYSANQERFALITLFTLLLTFFFHPPAVFPQVSVTTIGTGYTQNFDTLPASGSATWTNNSTIPGWFHARTGTGTTIVANDGSSNAGNLYSYGTGTATDRALGSLGSGNAAIGNLFWGVRLQNNTGATITSLNVAYTGEQWRNSAAAAQTIAFSYLVGSPTVTGSLAEFQSAGVAVSQLDFTSPVTGGAAGALNGNLAANRVAISHTITGLSIPNGTEIMLRWADPDHTGADHGLAIDDLTVTPNGAGGATPNLSINDVSMSEGNSGTTTFSFTVSLSQPAGAGGVTFDIATADGTAQDDNPTSEDNDYVAKVLTSQTIPAGSSSYTFDVTVNGDTTVEPNETFFVNVTNVTGANVTDGQGQGTIVNDEFVITPIHDIQGPGATSPIVGATVTTRGIVTLLKTGSNAGGGAANGFFLQEMDALVDADPNTSEGIFVFTSSVPTVAVGDSVNVTGTVVEFNGLTEITSPTVTLNSPGNTLPTAVTLTTADLPPTASPDQPQLEKYESMRVGGTLRTVAPNDSFYDVETVLSTVARPFREPGIEISNPVPPDPTSGTVDCCIPRWDENPERLKVDTNGRAGAPNLPYTSEVTFTGMTGPLDYTFSEYRLIPDAAPNASANISAVPVRTPAGNEFTVAGFNIENFNNNATQRQKAALTIRNILRYPDIIGTVEIFDLADLQALRDQVNNDAVAAGDPNPAYQAYLVEGDGTSEDSDQDVGFLVKTSRVSVTSVTQRNASETYINPNNGQSELLNDRPPLVLRAVVNPSQANASPVIVIVNHLRSFIDAELVAGEGPRVRAKRKAQAESLAALLQEYQTSDPTTPIISVGDYNAFQFSSGYDDSVSVIKGNPTPDEEIVVDQSPDLVNPDFYNLIDDLAAADKYTFIFEGTPQVLDHVIVNTTARNRNTGIAVAHVNADFPENPSSAYAGNASRPERNSDHDPVVSYYSLAAAPTADLSITKTDGVTTAVPGGSVTYTITASNAGPDAVTGATVSDTFPAALTATWTCVGAGGGTCTAAGSGNINDTVNLPAGGSVTYTATATISPSATGTLSNTATVSSSVSDPNPANNSATDTDTLTPQADLAITKTDGVTSVNAGGSVTYTITASNSGPSNASGATVSDTFPASLTATWTCVGAGGGTCTAAGSGNINDTVNLPAGGSVTYTVSATVSASATGTLSNTATVTAPAGVTDPNPANNSATDTDTINSSADLSITKTDSPDPVAAGNNLTYTIIVTNNGPGIANSVSMSDTLPAGTTFVSLSSPMGWSCSPPSVGSGGTVSCSISSLANAASATFTLVVNVATCTSGGTVLSNTATVSSSTSDTNSANNSATSTTTVTGETTPPVINPASYQNITVELPANSNATSAVVNFPLPTATDNCGSVTVTTNPASGSTFPVGTTTVTITATDAAGNTSTATFTVTVRYRFSYYYNSQLLEPRQMPYFIDARAGSNVSVSYSLSGYKGANPYSQPPTSQRINCVNKSPIGATTPISTFPGDPFYNAQYDFYTTIWRTQANYAGTCRRLTLYFNDGTTQSLDYRFN